MSDARIAVVHDERSADAGCFWQLTARNGRILGRSPIGFPEESLAIDALIQTLRYGGPLSLVVRHADDRAGWTWRVDALRQVTVMRSYRAYERYDSCRRSGKRVLDELVAMSGVVRPPCDGHARRPG